ncbi:MAG TPA: ABC transporter permease subunit [Candidatus Atribacteria bacterium]|nr:ABC transporter permease subunit [Candidatus Atribacteria bacterium]HPT78102.1 ABC transporter permease subunit [Candidatus Atribacteria bacterium]
MTNSNRSSGSLPKKRSNSERLTYNLLMWPGVILLFIFSIVPLFGLVIAFQNYIPAKGIAGSEWVGLDNFILIFSLPDSWRVLGNTLYIAIAKMSIGIVVPLIFAIMLNEVSSKRYKQVVQTVVYMPYFLSWVILGGIFLSMLSIDGVINRIIEMLGEEPVMFMADGKWARAIIILTDCWKNFGYGAIIYLAALTSIDLDLYEAAAIDGASRFRQILHVTVPALVPTVVLVATLNLGGVLNAGFDQIYNMYNPLVYDTIDIIDTFVYRMGLVDMQFSLGTAVGLFKSVVSFVLIVLSYVLAKKFTGYRIF